LEIPDTWNIFLAIPAFGILIWFLFWATATFQILGYIIFLGIIVLILYLKHPRRKEPEELDDHLPFDRWEMGQEKVIAMLRKVGDKEKRGKPD